jgi:hypothetical protein
MEHCKDFAFRFCQMPQNCFQGCHFKNNLNRKMVRIHATYHTSQMNSSPYCNEGWQLCTCSYVQTYTLCSSLTKFITRTSLNNDYRLLVWMKQNILLSFTVRSVYFIWYDMPSHLPVNGSFSCVIIKWTLL